MNRKPIVALDIGIVVLGIASFSDIAIWGWQLFAYAQDGQWHPYSLVDALLQHVAPVNSEFAWWLVGPTTWLGVHHVMTWLNAGWAITALQGPISAIFVLIWGCVVYVRDIK